MLEGWKQILKYLPHQLYHDTTWGSNFKKGRSAACTFYSQKKTVLTSFVIICTCFIPHVVGQYTKTSSSPTSSSFCCNMCPTLGSRQISELHPMRLHIQRTTKSQFGTVVQRRNFLGCWSFVCWIHKIGIQEGCSAQLPRTYSEAMWRCCRG